MGSRTKRLGFHVPLVADDQAASWLLRLRIRHLEAFRTIVRTGSQSETAALMHITQPASGIGRLHGQALGAELQSEALYEEPVLA